MTRQRRRAAAPPNVTPEQARELQRRLLAWFRKHRRDMPWRGPRDPYAIWVSEVMLQQTQVATATPYYERFLARFPSVQALAKATDQAVLKVWQGLGYYRRALNLHAAARVVVRDHDGRVPDEPEAFARLPGVGRYTCGAVQSIAFGRRLAALDGNAIRVLARWFAITGDVTRPATREALWHVAEAMVPDARGRSPGDWNQAVMELGSEVCTPRSPRCEECPMRSRRGQDPLACQAQQKRLQGRIPVRRKRKPVPHIEVGVGIIWRRGRILLCQRRADAMLGGLWEFPGGKRHPDETIQECIRRELKEECDLNLTVGDHLIDVTHTYSHLRVTLRCYHCQAGRGRVRLLGCADARWVRPQQIVDYPLPAADVRVLEALGINHARARRAARGKA